MAVSDHHRPVNYRRADRVVDRVVDRRQRVNCPRVGRAADLQRPGNRPDLVVEVGFQSKAAVQPKVELLVASPVVQLLAELR